MLFNLISVLKQFLLNSLCIKNKVVFLQSVSDKVNKKQCRR